MKERRFRTRLLEQTDHVRWSPFSGELPGQHKEWFHFSISTGDLDCLINFSIVDGALGRSKRGAPITRLTLLARRSVWTGEITPVNFSRAVIDPGFVGMHLNDSFFELSDRVSHLRASSIQQDIRIDLHLEPAAVPSLVHNVELGEGPPLHWLMVPRLLTFGEVFVGDQRIVFNGELAYHDHNWGRFSWGGDFAWEWGYALPQSHDCPWTVVFVRMNDRAHHRTLSQGIFIWRGQSQVRIFRNHAVGAARKGLLRQRNIAKFPPVMGLLYPGTATDIPQEYRIEGRRGDDHVELDFTPEDVAQIIVPADGLSGATVIQEVAGAIVCRGCIDGESWSFDSRTVVEFLRG